MSSTGHDTVPDPPPTPRVADALVRRALRTLWGVDAAEISRLPGEVDANLRVTDRDGHRSILKFSDSGTDRRVLEMQHAALAHLRGSAWGERRARGIPRVLPTTSGERVAEFEGHRVRRLAWVEGSTVASAVPPRLLPSPATDRFMRSIGSFLGGLDAALADFDHPAADRTHPWDPLAAAGVADALGGIASVDRRTMLERVVSAWSERVAPRMDTLPRTVIHADANDHNLLVDAGVWWDGPVGLIDFGDMLRTARVCEPAVAAAYAAMRSVDPVGAVAEVTAGWLDAWEAGVWGPGSRGDSGSRVGGPRVEDEELALVPVLVRARLAISVVTSARRTVDRPDDPYVTVSEAGAWRVLEALDHVADADATARVLRSCGRAGPAGATPPASVRPAAALRSDRARLTAPNLSLSYAEPIHAVRGWMQWLYDADGTAFLDVYNNVPHVGHSHPRVAEAIARQTSLLATNTRYLSQVRLDYLERLAARFPDPLDTVYLVNSASEANELALRIVRAATGRRDVLVQEAGYHGNTTTLIEASPYKADGPGGGGTPGWVHTLAIPDPYRGRWRAGRDDDPGAKYAADVERLARRLEAEDRPPGALLLETFPSVGGQIVPPDGYLEGAFAAVRAVGGLVIADEVQTGFGRLGVVEWGFETAPVVPDLVVLGKPMGNGFPLAAVVTTRELAETFDTGMEFFSTYGGNPVGCAAGAAVLDVLDEGDLAAASERVGARLLAGLRNLAEHHEVVGEVRGLGLFVGVEFVADRSARTPSPAAARAAVEGLRARGILAGTDGPDGNVLKLRGPLAVTPADVDRVVGALEAVLSEVDVSGGGRIPTWIRRGESL